MWRRIRRIIFWAIGVPIGLAVVGVGAFVGYVFYLSSQTPSISSLHPRAETSNSIVYAANGARLGFIPAAQLRQPVPSADIPAVMKQSIVAIEDRRFYQHNGVDYPAILRAAAKDVASDAVVQGGSTITMQLVRTLYLNPQRTFRRKIEEATLAREMERRRSKDWILTQYLNDVSFGTVGGQEAVGVQAAARVYFGRPASALNLTESALLAGLPQAPTLYSPVRHPAAAKARRAQVLKAMVRAGMIEQAVADRINAHGLGLHLSDYYTHRRERHFFDYVERQLRHDLGTRVVDQGGLRVYTTLNLKLQHAARQAIRGRLNRPHDPAAAVVTINAHNGDIVTMATTEKYEREQFDYASQGHRQPGSTFKPVVLLAAIDGKQVDPRRTYYVSKPLNLHTGFGPVKVKTYEGTYGGRMNLVKATLLSDNTVYEQLDLDVGPDQVADTAANMGIDTPLDGYPAEGLGGVGRGITPLELARAYATLANGGTRLNVSAIKSVRLPNGQVKQLDNIGDDSLFKDGEVYPVTQILRQNMKHGTGTAAQIGCPAAGKTGTTDTFRDAWFAGYTPRLSTVVWVGYPHRAVPMLNVHGIKVAGATFPAQIWHDYMEVAKGGFCGKFPKPVDSAVLKPFCGHYTVTKHCAAPPDGAAEPVPTATGGTATGGVPVPTTTVPALPPLPDTTIADGPPASTLAHSARFSFEASGAKASGFECRIDSQAFAACTSPIVYTGVAPGQHVFSARALAPDRRPDGTPATWSWTVYSDLQPSSPDAPPPQAHQPKRKKAGRRQTQPSQPPIVG